MHGEIEVAHDGESITMNAKAGADDSRRETVTRCWHRNSTLAFESTIDGWSAPSGVAVTLMFLAPNGILKGHTLFYDEILDKPFFSPHIAYRKKIRDGFAKKQAMVWFNVQVRAVELGIRGSGIPSEFSSEEDNH